MNYLFRMTAITWLFIMFSLTTICHAQEPDSVYTQEYVTAISVSEPHRALKLIDEMEARKSVPAFRLDYLRSIVYQNGLSMFRTALSYSLKAYHTGSLSLHREPDAALALLELITDQYNTTGNYTESIRYAIKGIELAKQAGNKNSEANLLLYIGINKRDMGLKDEANQYVEQAIRIQEQEAEGSREWSKVDDLIYIYGTQITFALEDRKFREAIDLLPRYEKLMEQLSACPDIPDGVYDMRLASVYAAFAYIFVANGQPDKGAECYRKFEETGYASTDDGNQMRFDYLIATGRYREALQHIHRDKQLYQSQGDTINYIYIERDLQLEAQAYTGLGDYKAAAQIYHQMYTLSDSLRIREKQNGVLDFATLYETKEKEAQLAEQTARLHESRMILIFAVCIICLMGFLLWRIALHTRIVKAKNRAMTSKIDDLLKYKDELFRRKEENLKLTEQLQAVKSEQEEVTETSDIDRALFDRAEHEIISRKLFLQPDFSRDELIKLVHIPKNKFSSLFKQYAGVGFPQYINNLRLDYATRMLKEHPEYSVDAIAQSCGFSSSSTFYRLFPEQFGMPPADYRKSQRQL